MSRDRSGPWFRFKRIVRKFFVSAFVVFTFVAYALHERLGGASAASDALAPAPGVTVTPLVTAPEPTPTAADVTAAAPTPEVPATEAPPTQAPVTQVPATPRAVLAPTPTRPPANGSQYKDGQYTGDVADAYYGNVQVEVTIQGGKIADVAFVEFPNDRRTSIRINREAVPDLQTEAVQAQSANVDIISGATLTSRAFVQSLRSALDAARAHA